MATQAPLGRMVVELGLDTTDFGKGLQSSKREVRTWSNEMRTNMRAADIAGDKVGKLGAQHDGLTKIISAQQKQVDSIRQSYENSFVDGRPTAQTEKLAAQLKNAEGQLLNYNKQLINNAGEMAKLKVETEGFTGAMNKFGKGMQTTGKHMTNVGDTMTKRVTAPIVAGVGLAVKAAMDWESAFAGVQKVNEEIVDANGNVVYSFSDLEDELRELSKELPATHAEIAGVAQAAGQLGIQTDNVTGFTKTMIDMGEATNMSSEQAATSMARMANITNMSQQDFDRLGSSIVQVGNNFATTESEITEMAMRLAAAGSQVGMTEADIVGLAGALSSVGIEAQAGGTAISRTLVDMQLAVENGTDQLEDFANVAGVSVDEFSKAFQEDAAGALGIFIEGLGNAEEHGQSAIAMLDEMGISEVRLRDALLRAGNASEMFADAIGMSNQAFEENETLTREANIRYETLESQLGMLRNEANDIAITFGGPFVGALKDGLVAARPLLEQISNVAIAFSEADESTQQMIIRTLAFAAAAGPTLSIVGRLTSGIGNMTTNTVGFLAQMAKRNTVKQMTAELVDGTLQIRNFGDAAGTAAGTKGVAGMTGALGGLSGAIWPIVGVGGALAVGYGAWKLWGEEAYEAGQRTKRWGTDVGEATDEALTEVQGFSNDAIGQFGLMEEGLNTNVESMISSFQSMGTSIENDLNRQIEAFRETINMLPEEIQDAAEEILQESIESREGALEVVEDHNERISEIRERAAQHNREVSALEAQEIRQLMEQSAEEYLRITIDDKDAREQVLAAMTGDVESASKEQATAWVQSLGEQRQAANDEYNEQRKDLENHLKEQGIYSDEAIQDILRLFEQSRDNTVGALDAQIAAIAEKYPELIDEVSFGTGEMIKHNDRMADAWVGKNEEIIRNAESMTNQMAESAAKNAELISWSADLGIAGAETWNSIILDEKTGEVKTNVREEIIDASESADTWNNIRFQLQNADLDSNAASIIGEAAIVNDWWDGMSWDDKAATINDEFSETVIKAMHDSGTWNELEVEEKTALLYSNTPETMTETLAQLGLWDEYYPKDMELQADNQTFMTILAESEEKMKVWNSIDPEVQELLGENQDLLTKIFQSEEELNRFKQIPDEQKAFLAENSELLAAVTSSEENYNRWTSLPDPTKEFLGKNEDLLLTIISSEAEYNRWQGLPMMDKNMIGDNTDLLSTILSSEEQYNHWMSLPEEEKRLLANSSGADPVIQNTTGLLNNYDSTDPDHKSLTADNHGANPNIRDATNVLSNFNSINPQHKRLQTSTNANSTSSTIRNLMDRWRNWRPGSKTLNAVSRVAGRLPGFAKGTNYHHGGPAIVNDQKGSKFRELIIEPGKNPYIPTGRDVLLPNLAKGAKVVPANITERMFPKIKQYAEGVGIPRSADIIQNLERVNEAQSNTSQSGSTIVNNDFSTLENLMTQMLNVLSRLQPNIEINVENMGATDMREIDEGINFLTQVTERGRMR